MSNTGYLKGQCAHCRGRIEFPPEYVNQSIACPHCQQMTPLTAVPAPAPAAPPPPAAPARPARPSLGFKSSAAAHAAPAAPATSPAAPAAEPAKVETAEASPAPNPASRRGLRRVLIFAVAGCLVLGLGVLGFILFAKMRVAKMEVVQWKMEPGEYRTFYLQGTISNTTGRVVSNVEVTFDLLDSFGATSGVVVAKLESLQPHATADFKTQTSETQVVWDAKLRGALAR